MYSLGPDWRGDPCDSKGRGKGTFCQAGDCVRALAEGGGGREATEAEVCSQISNEQRAQVVKESDCASLEISRSLYNSFYLRSAAYSWHKRVRSF